METAWFLISGFLIGYTMGILHARLQRYRAEFEDIRNEIADAMVDLHRGIVDVKDWLSSKK